MLLEANGIGGHFTALGRNFCLGEPDALAVKYWELCLKMQDFAAERLKPGAVIKEIFDENVKYIESLGHRTNMQNYLHSLGYVLGEKPYLHDPSETIPLRENMVYLNHPHVRIDRGADTGKVVYDDFYAIDTYRVTKEGGVRQNKIPRELIVIE
jgi:Xaa-Pro aminopeptidase